MPKFRTVTHPNIVEDFDGWKKRSNEVATDLVGYVKVAANDDIILAVDAVCTACAVMIAATARMSSDNRDTQVKDVQNFLVGVQERAINVLSKK